MIFPAGAARRTSLEAASQKTYDAVIVGSGVAGSIIANELSRKGKTVLIVDVSPGEDRTLKGYEAFLSLFYATAEKDNQSPYPRNPNAPMPRGSDVHQIPPGNTEPLPMGYLVQQGPLANDSTYTRVFGGTTMHWEGKVLRMLPEEFEMQTRFGQAQDWPIKYEELKPYYQMAEHEMGVSGDVADEPFPEIFPEGYVFPMHKMPLSYLDKMVGKGIDGTRVELFKESYELKVRTFPQARNGIPNPDYVGPDGVKGYRPVGAVSTHQVEEGGRCQGNDNCVPICPVQAKYNAGKTLAKALLTGRVDLLAQSVASKILIDHENGHVTGIEVKHYHDPTVPDPDPITKTVRGQIYVLAANPIENPRLMLASGLQSRNDLVGRNLMDHAYLLSWALMPEDCGTMRGTNVTGGITALRGGSFRDRQAAFSVDIHNDGWGWAKGSPYWDLEILVEDYNKFGPALRRDLANRITRQLLLAFMIEILPSRMNRVTVDSDYTDHLGNMRPVIHYTIPDYTMRGAAYARRFARLMFERLGAEDHTEYDPTDYGYVPFEGEGYAMRGGNHLAGTHMMGTNRKRSVVTPEQRSWDYENLYLVGGGSMPTIGTANVTDTVAALCYRSAEFMINKVLS